MKTWVLLLGCISLALAQAPAGIHEPGHEEEPELIRCARPSCFQHFCPHGYLPDERGCPSCNCHEDPCMGVTCEDETHHCHPKDCHNGDCSIEDHECLTDEEWQKRHECPILEDCSEHCFHGWIHNGFCRTCECYVQPCEENDCAEDERCMPLNCRMKDCTERKYKCVAKDYLRPPCPEVMCANDCGEKGYMSSRGCQTCMCNIKVDGSTSNADRICAYNKQLAVLIAEQMEKTGVSPVPDSIREHLNHGLDCNEDGSYNPRQCHDNGPECWCVDDRGMELENTRVDTNTKAHPHCVHHVTKEISMKMVLFHSYDNIDEHLDSIRDAVKSHMSEWLDLDEEFIDVIEALPNNGEKIVKVEIVLHHDASSDLSYLVKKFMMDSRENEHIIECPQGGHLTVDAHNLQVSHKSVAVNPMMQEDESEDDNDDVEGWFREHKYEAMFSAFGAFLLILFGIGACVVGVRVCRKRKSANAQFKHAKMDKYKENLAFQNDMLGGNSEKVKTTTVVIKAEESEPVKY